MKAFAIAPLIYITFLLLNCHKADNTVDNGCGCNTDSIVANVTYDNFLSFQYDGNLTYYVNNYNQGAWYLGFHVVNSSKYGICKICNSNSPGIRAFTDTSSKKYLIPVKIAGSLRKLCANEPPHFGLNTLPESVSFYITVDSLIKK